MSEVGKASADADRCADRTYHADVVVAGSGNGGLSAAIAAAERGASVIVLEIDVVSGGSSAWSGGGIHIGHAATYDEYLRNTRGMHEPRFSKTYFDQFSEYTGWLERIGAAIRRDPAPALTVRMGREYDKPSQPQARTYFDSLEDILKSLSGRILFRHRAVRILTDDAGAIIGLRARQWSSSPSDAAGETVDILAPRVVLATGGFQNNKEMCGRFIGTDADLATAMCTPFHRGDGLVMAQEAGAALSPSMNGIYGSYMSAYPAAKPMEDREAWVRRDESSKTDLFNLLCFTVPPGWIAVNSDGRRYIDEAEPYYRIAQATVRQPRAFGLMLFDRAMFDEVADQVILTPGSGLTERQKFTVRERLEGASLMAADSLEALADRLAAPGPHMANRANLLATLAEIADTADRGTGALAVAKTQPRKLTAPPFYAWPFTAGIVFTMGGVAIDADARVLDQEGRPIAGLYAAPPCAGGVFREYYAGAIGCAGVFGRIAGYGAASRA